MAKEKDLIIQAPRQGIAQSPHVGFGNMRNLDIYTVPGVAKLNNILVKKSSTTVDAQVKWIVKNPASPANVYALDSNGVMYTSADSGASWTETSDRGGAGQGLAVWKDYLFVFEDTTVDVFGPLSGSPTWDDNWATIGTAAAWHPTFISNNDGNLYFGCGRYIGMITEASGQDFDPDTSATYAGSTLGTSADNSLDLPEDYKIKCLSELGNNLMIGTWQGTNIYDNKIADIFPWDRSATSFGQPVKMTENGVNSMINIGGYLYIQAGIDGKIYKSNGVQASVIAQIPLSIADTSNAKYLEPYPGAIINFKGRPFFGISSADVASGMGIYSLMETSKGTILNFEHFISEEITGSANPTVIGALLGITRDQLVVGWRNHATYGIDQTSTASFAYTTDYGGYFESPLYSVGTTLNKRAFTQLEFQLAKELATDEGIQIKYRVNLTDTFTTIGTYTFAILGAVTSHNVTADIPACDQLQIRVELLGTATTTPEFKSLTLR